MHGRGVETGFAFDEVAKTRVFDDHFGPERVAREAEEELAVRGGDFDDDVGPAGDNMFGGFDFLPR